MYVEEAIIKPKEKIKKGIKWEGDIILMTC